MINIIILISLMSQETFSKFWSVPRFEPGSLTYEPAV